MSFVIIQRANQGSLLHFSQKLKLEKNYSLCLGGGNPLTDNTEF